MSEQPARLPLRLIVADDEPLARDRARRLLDRAGGVEILAEAADGAEALALIERLHPDAVLLDINMPGIDGLRVLEALDDPPAAIFATAYDHHAVKAFELDAIDYLLKPYSAERLAKALEKARRHLVQLHPAAAPQPRISADSGLETLLLDPMEIDAATIEEGVLFLLHQSGENYTSALTLQELEDQLPHEQFLRISRQSLVNCQAIRSWQALPDGRMALSLRSGTERIASRRRAAHLRILLKRIASA